MSDLPQYVVSGQPARLFPVLADTSKEGRTLSVFLSCLSAIPELSGTMLGSLGQRTGVRSSVETYTEVILSENHDLRKLRPDGLIVLSTGARTWRALIEAKIGNAELNAEQVENYLRLARANKIDAVITISNQFVTSPDISPTSVSKTLLRSVGLFHWSWMSILTQINLLISSEEIENTDRLYVLSELLQFLRHPSAGISSFDRMNSEWKELVAQVKAGANPPKTSSEIRNTVLSWHQEVRDLGLILTRKIGKEVKIRLSRAHVADQTVRLRDDAEILAREKKLTCSFQVPEAASQIDVEANLLSRSICVSMKLAAPADRRSTKARINWLLRFLKKTGDAADIHVRALWPGKAPSTQAPLAELRISPETIEHDRRDMVASSFEVLLVRDLAGRFSGSQTFIESLEDAVPSFWELVGQHLREWQPQEPTKKQIRPSGDAEEPTQSQTDQAASAMLNITSEELGTSTFDDDHSSEIVETEPTEQTDLPTVPLDESQIVTSQDDSEAGSERNGAHTGDGDSKTATTDSRVPIWRRTTNLS